MQVNPSKIGGSALESSEGQLDHMLSGRTAGVGLIGVELRFERRWTVEQKDGILVPVLPPVEGVTLGVGETCGLATPLSKPSGHFSLPTGSVIRRRISCFGVVVFPTIAAAPQTVEAVDDLALKLLQTEPVQDLLAFGTRQCVLWQLHIDHAVGQSEGTTKKGTQSAIEGVGYPKQTSLDVHLGR